MNTMRLVSNVVAFQLGWFACVLGAAYGQPWSGTAAAIAIICWHLSSVERPGPELALVLIAAGLGALWDSALVMLGWIHYPTGTLIEGAAPHWIVALWMLFATTLNVSLGWLKRSVPMAAAFGLLGGPLAYLGGSKLGALVLVEPSYALTALALGWAVLTPLLLHVATRFDGVAPDLNPALESEGSRV
ncbi:MAG: DUF2878 domain-containing protein [Burkholderiales bacterium]